MSRLISALFLIAGLCAVAAVAQEKPSDSRIFISNVTVINTETGSGDCRTALLSFQVNESRR